MRLIAADLWCLNGGRKRLCSKGIRQWFESEGLDYEAFLRDGIEAEALAHVTDPRLELVIQRAQQRLESDA